jgi:CDP-diacylglycerol---serine O-phosphatidyltransferase
MQLKRHIPNFFTCLNLFSGSIALVFAFQDQLHISAILIGIAAVFDFMDGLFARLLNAYSETGKELDSLADLVSFGLTPSIVLFQYLQQTASENSLSCLGINLISVFAFSIVIFSALRLAKFNTDNRQKESFLGLPTPANAIFIMSLPLLLHYGSKESIVYNLLQTIVANQYILIGIIITTAFLLVSEIPLFSLKFSSLKFGGNKVRYYFFGGAIVLYLILGLFALPFIIIYYVILSVVNSQFTKTRSNPSRNSVE